MSYKLTPAQEKILLTAATNTKAAFENLHCKRTSNIYGPDYMPTSDGYYVNINGYFEASTVSDIKDSQGVIDVTVRIIYIPLQGYQFYVYPHFQVMPRAVCKHKKLWNDVVHITHARTLDVNEAFLNSPSTITNNIQQDIISFVSKVQQIVIDWANRIKNTPDYKIEDDPDWDPAFAD